MKEDCWFLDANFTSLQVKDDEPNDNHKSWLSLQRETSGTGISLSREGSKRGNKFNPANVLSSRILRRHTTYIKSVENVNSFASTPSGPESLAEGSQKPAHVHSWHKKGHKTEDFIGNKKRRKQVKDHSISTYIQRKTLIIDLQPFSFNLVITLKSYL